MASSFPGAIDSFTTKVDGIDDVMAAHVNDLQDSVVSVETILQMMMTGWVPEQDTWVYVSATSFKIVGKDVRSKFPTGIKLKCTDGGSTKYFYGISAAMSGSDTLVTIIGGSDYSLSGGAITNPHYGYGDSLPLFPGWFSYTSTPLGTSGSVGSYAEDLVFSKFSISGRALHLVIRRRITNLGSWSGLVYFPAPVNPILFSNAPCTNSGGFYAQGTITYSPKISLFWGGLNFLFFKQLYTVNAQWSDLAANDFMIIDITYQI